MSVLWLILYVYDVWNVYADVFPTLLEYILIT